MLERRVVKTRESKQSALSRGKIDTRIDARLTARLSQDILGMMSTRPALMLLFVLVLALLVCASTVCLAPSGHGSFSAVHGPNSIFVAKRAAGRALSLIRTTPIFALLPALAAGINAVKDLALSPLDERVVICILTC